MNAERILMKAKVQTIRHNPFFAYLVLSLEEKEEPAVGTAGVNIKGELYYNPQFIEELYQKNELTVESVLVHEVMHLALQHPLRKGHRDKDIFNIACDIVINNMLVNEGYVLPEGVIIPRDNQYTIKELGYTVKDIDKKTSEQIYSELVREMKKQGKGKLDGEGKKVLDKHLYGEGGLSEKEKKKWERYWKKKFSEAVNQAKMRGNLPAGLELYVDEILQEKLNWKAILWRFVTNEIPFDYTWAKPSKKSISSGYYLPATVRENLEVVVTVDTSGSIGKKELTEFVSEIIGIAKSFRNVKMRLITHDIDVHDDYEVSNGNIAKIKNLKFHGGGGTSHTPVFEYINKRYPHARFVVSLTDGYTEVPRAIRQKVLWVITEDGTDRTVKDKGVVAWLK